jgi:hypothetical protein
VKRDYSRFMLAFATAPVNAAVLFVAASGTGGGT